MKVFINSYLADVTGKTELNFDCPEAMTLKNFFDRHLFEAYPELKHRIADENGAVRRHVAVFIGETHIKFLERESSRVSPKDDIYIFPAVSGG